MKTMLALTLLMLAGAVPIYASGDGGTSPRRRGPLTSRCW